MGLLRRLGFACFLVVTGCGDTTARVIFRADAGRDAREAGGRRVDAARDAGDDAPGVLVGPLDADLSGCAVGTDLVYVVSGNTQSLYSFDPSVLRFTRIGLLTCEPGTSPFSMSVARDGYAWVNYQDGRLFRVSLQDASCTPTTFMPGQQGFTTFGLGFSADSPGGAAETLYACWTQGLARIDTTSLTLTPIGTLPGLDVSNGCDLTGNGAGALYSFISQSSGWILAELDKTTSAPLSQKELSPPIPAGGAWGTSFWGGDLYLYTAPTGSSIVWRYRPSDQTTTMLVPDVGFTIVGAGQSTCAPIAMPPK